ncbi:MAG: NAD/NADP octopine/nopaline dehydrogenase family protein [Bacillota bacterium]
MKKVNIAILGAGNGGLALAGFLAWRGYKTKLFNRSENRLTELIENPVIKLQGLFQGEGRLEHVSTNIAEVIDGADVIIIVTPANGHEFMAELLAEHLVPGQVILLSPGRTGGCLEFKNILNKNSVQTEVILAETQTFLFASRSLLNRTSHIFGAKRIVEAAVFPAEKTEKVAEMLHPIFPQFVFTDNILKTGLDNIGAIFHPAPTLLNMAWIESTGGKFNYYQEGISQSVAKVLAQMDNERMKVAEAFGIKPVSAEEWLRISYGAEGETLYELLQANEYYHGIRAPIGLNHRYITEDVPMSLVPISSLAKLVNIETSTIDLIINLASLVGGVDYRSTGRNLKRLGLEGLSIDEIYNLVNWGNILGEDNVVNYQWKFRQKENKLIREKGIEDGVLNE